MSHVTLLVVASHTAPVDAVVVDLAGEPAEAEAADSGLMLSDWNVGDAPGPGIWLWEGAVQYLPGGYYEPGEGDWEWSGEWRRPTATEAWRLARGLPVLTPETSEGGA